MLSNSSDVLLHVILWIHLIQNTGAYIPSGYLGCFEDYNVRVLPDKSHFSSQNSGEYCKNICKGFRYAGTEYGYECYCGNNMTSVNASNGCDSPCFGNQDEICGGHWRISVYDILRTSTSKISALTQTTDETNGRESTAISSRKSITSLGYLYKTGSSVNAAVYDLERLSDNCFKKDLALTMTETRTSALTATPKTKIANGQDNNPLSSRNLRDSSVSLVVVAALATAVIFFLWRRKRLRSPNTIGGNPETPTTNLHYEGLRPAVSAESEYMDLSYSNLYAENNAASVYQNTDTLQMDQAESKSDYYLDVAENQLIRKSSEATYANTPHQTNA